MKKYQMPSECMGFVINYRDVDCFRNPRFLTQGFECEGAVYQVSIVVDYAFEMHAYDASEFEGLSVPIEVATLKDGEYWGATDIEWRPIASDLELGEFLHDWVKSILSAVKDGE